jgi:hypothetical protein
VVTVLQTYNDHLQARHGGTSSGPVQVLSTLLELVRGTSTVLALLPLTSTVLVLAQLQSNTSTNTVQYSTVLVLVLVCISTK